MPTRPFTVDWLLKFGKMGGGSGKSDRVTAWGHEVVRNYLIWGGGRMSRSGWLSMSFLSGSFPNVRKPLDVSPAHLRWSLHVPKFSDPVLRWVLHPQRSPLLLCLQWFPVCAVLQGRVYTVKLSVTTHTPRIGPQVSSPIYYGQKTL